MDDIKDIEIILLEAEHKELHDFLKLVGSIGDKSNKYYLTYMAMRLLEMKRILKDTGSIYFHCDSTMGHYIKLLMDVIFGYKSFRNEIIWCYKSGGASKKKFSKKHDTIFFYSKSKDYHFNHMKEKSYGSSGGGQGGKVQYFKDEKGTYSIVGMKDWWEISILSTTHPERLGYPTQKPLALLERIIEASCPKDGIVLDPFCGCATTCVAAEKLEREWIGVDISEKAFELVNQRLENEVANKEKLFQYNIDVNFQKEPPLRTDIEELSKKEMQEHKKYLYGHQQGLCNGCRVSFQINNLEIDHITPQVKGGTDTKDNLQLLCGNCNRIKGKRPMSYLVSKINDNKDIKYKF